MPRSRRRSTKSARWSSVRAPKLSERIWLIALSEDSGLPKRLRAVRAGCDAFIALPAKPADVIARIGELIETERTNPYRIMIVEDDRSQTLFAESILRKAGHGNPRDQ